MKFNFNSALEQAKQSFQGKATSFLDQLKSLSPFKQIKVQTTSSPTPNPWIEKGWTQAGEGYYRPSNSGYSFVDREKIPAETLGKLGALPILAASPTPTLEQTYKDFTETAPSQVANNGSYEDYIRRGLRKYADAQAGGTRLPIEAYVPLLAQAPPKYEIFKKYPWLPAALSILESSGGLNVTRENNPLNWAARIQKAGGYAPSSWEQSINDALTAIGGDYEARPKGSARGRNADYYQPFRDTQDLKTFADIYEPANKGYYNNLLDLQNLFGQFNQ